MIDTIVFRIHDLKKHHEIVAYLHKKNVDGSSKYVKEIPDSDFLKKIYNSEYWIDWSTGRRVETAYRGKLPSYHYEIAISISFARDYLEFNFSVPKYLYRTNVFQFVPHYFDADYSLVYGNSIEQRGQAAYKRLKRFLNWFFKVELSDRVDRSDVQIVRLDLCFNKLFRYRHESLDYMKDLKRIKKKHARESKIFTDGEFLGLYYVTDDYTFKVYHKGLEFSVHDAVELRRQGVSKEKIQTLQDFADRMVRYEVEFRTGMLDKVYKRFCFRKGSVKWKKARRYYFQYSRNGYIIKDGKKLYRTPPNTYKDAKGNTWDYTRKEIEEMKMSKMQMSLVKYGEFFTNKTFQFFLDAESHVGIDSEVWDAEILSRSFTMEYEQRFNQKLWNGCVFMFLVFYREFSVQYQEDIRYVANRIKEAEEIKKDQSVEFFHELKRRTNLPDEHLRKISFKQFLFYLEMLKNHSFNEIKQMNIIPERTFYRYKKVFMELGFTDYAPSQLVPRGDDTFTDYFFWVEDVNTKLNFENLFKSKF